MPARPRLPMPWLWLTLALAAGLAVISLFVFTELEVPDIRQAAMRLNTPATITLMAVLPLGGLSISLVYLIAGAKFGFWIGGLLVTGLTAVHLLASHGIAHGALRAPMDRWLQKRRQHLPNIPANDDIAASLLTVLVPGIPYAVRNYFLPLAGVPLRIYFWICLPIYVAHAYLAFLLVELAADPGGQRLLMLGVLYAVKLAICAEVIRRVRKRHFHNRAPGWP